MSLKQEIRLFLWALIARWWALMSCAVFTFIGLYALLSSKSNSWVVGASFTAAAVLFVVAAFLAWRDQYRARLKAENTIEALRSEKPEFRIRLAVEMVAPAGTANKDAAVLLTGTITNLGSPSVAPQFWMDIKLKDGRIFHGEWPAIPKPEDKLTIGKSRDGHDIFVVGKEHWLLNSTHIIPKDGALNGWLLAIFRGVTAEDIWHGNGTVTLTCSDARGERYSVDHTFTALPSEMPLGLNEVQAKQGKQGKRR